MRLTVETVGIRLSVCLSVSVRQAGSLDSTLAVSTVEVSVCLFVLLLVYVCGPESGDDPRISVEATKLTIQTKTLLESLIILFLQIIFSDL